MFPRYQDSHFNPVNQGHIKNVLFMLKEPHVETKKKTSTHALSIDRYADMQCQTEITLLHIPIPIGLGRSALDKLLQVRLGSNT
jgi:hypothetical protein